MSPQEGSPEAVAPLIQDAARGLSPYVRLLHSILTLLRRLAPAIQVTLAVIGLVIAIYYANKLRNRLMDGQEVVTKALHANLETTAHPHKGVAAFLLSGIEKDLPVSEEFRVNERLKTSLSTLDEKIKKIVADPKDFNPADAYSSLQLEVTNPGSASAWQKAIVARNSPDRFLMVPAIALSRQQLVDQPLDNENLMVVLKHNPEVLYDLYLAAKLEPDFQGLDDRSSIQSLNVVQTYFITESGVIRLHTANVEDQTAYYRDQFPTQTLFRDRPYFWQAVQGSGQSNEISPFDFRSEPYIDLGGNGLIETYSKRLQLPNNRAAVICLDVKLPRSSIDAMKERLAVLGASFDDFYWTQEQEKDDELPADFKWFAEDIKASINRKEQSRFVGSIAMESNDQASKPTANQLDTLRFTVPLGSSVTANNVRRTRLLWVRVDFAAIRASLSRDLMMFLVGTVVFVLLSWTMFLEYNVLGREMTGVLKKMTKVMHEATTPFVWLDDKNSFVDVNQAFLKTLEYENIEDLKHKKTTFRSLISAEHQEVYDKVLEESRAGRETGKYKVNMMTGRQRVLHVVVHGERVPYPTFLKRSLPHRFGILLRVIDPAMIEEQPEVKRDEVVYAKAFASHA